MTREHKVFAEYDGWKVIDSFENVPEGRYEVRDHDNRRYGIWETVEAARAHMIAMIAQQDTEIAYDWITTPTEETDRCSACNK